MVFEAGSTAGGFQNAPGAVDPGAEQLIAILQQFATDPEGTIEVLASKAAPPPPSVGTVGGQAPNDIGTAIVASQPEQQAPVQAEPDTLGARLATIGQAIKTPAPPTIQPANAAPAGGISRGNINSDSIAEILKAILAGQGGAPTPALGPALQGGL